MTPAVILFILFLITFAVLIIWVTLSIRLASRLTEAEHQLRDSRNAHARDVKELTTQLLKAKRERHDY